MVEVDQQREGGYGQVDLHHHARVEEEVRFPEIRLQENILLAYLNPKYENDSEKGDHKHDEVKGL